MIRDERKQGFWRVVRDCLTEFHGLGQNLAEEKVKAAEAEVGDEDVAYKWEPWSYANDLSTPISITGHLGAYRNLCFYHNSLAEQHIQINEEKVRMEALAQRVK
jgi:hypothetical protein